MVAIDVDRMVQLEETAAAARDRFYAARECGDADAMRKASREWTAADRAADDYALGKVKT